MIAEKLSTSIWFLQRTSHWRHGLELGLRKFRLDHDKPEIRRQARRWAATFAVDMAEALTKVGLTDLRSGMVPELSPALLEDARSRATRSAVKMGGPGDLGLIYAATCLSGARRVVETGVAYGWSSLAILAGMRNEPDGKLVSVDMPYPKLGNEQWVGVAVPDELRDRWKLVREPDRNGLKRALALCGGVIDLCHYDSDKSYWGRQYGYGLLWRALRPGGVFISDDIQDNFAFKEFVEAHGANFAVTASEHKYVGIVRKL